MDSKRLFLPFIGLCISLIQYQNCGKFDSAIDTAELNLSTNTESTPFPEIVDPQFTNDDLRKFDAGASLYKLNRCNNCHGNLEVSSKRKRSFSQILAAIETFPQMQSIKLSEAEAESIAFALGNSRPQIIVSIPMDDGEDKPREQVSDDMQEIIDGQEDPQSALNPFLCQADSIKNPQPLNRLSKAQLTNLIQDLFGQEALAAVKSYLALLPEDKMSGDLTEYARTYSKSEVQTLQKIADELGALVESNNTVYSTIRSHCTSTAGNTSKKVLEVESMEVFGSHYRVSNDSKAGSGKYVDSPDSVESTTQSPNYNQGIKGGVENISGSTNVWVRAQGINPQSDSFFFQVNGGQLKVVNGIKSGSFNWYKVGTYSLEAGNEQRLIIFHREKGTRLDQVLLTNDLNYTPTGIESSVQVTGSALVSTSCSSTKKVVEALTEKAFRRPATDGELEAFDDVLRALKNDRKALSFLARILLQSPNFLYHVQVGEPGQGTDRSFKLSQYELAAKVSFLLTDSLPDNGLIDLARKGQLRSRTTLDAEFERIISTARAKNKFSKFLEYWLDHEDVASLPIGPEPYLGDLDVQGLRKDLLDESKEYFLHMLLEKRTNYADLMTSNLSFARTPASASVYGHQPVKGSTPARMEEGRVGLALRAPMMFSSGFQTRPIIRGVKFRSQILCDEIPPPTADNFNAGPDINTLEMILNKSTRERTDLQTSSQTCFACHQYINPVGFAFEKFDTFGRIRDIEIQYNSDDGSVLATHEIDTSSSLPPINAKDVDFSFADSVEMMHAIAQGSQGPACFSKQVFRFYTLRDEGEYDSCVLQSMFTSGDKSGTLIDSVKSLILHESFQVKDNL